MMNVMAMLAPVNDMFLKKCSGSIGLGMRLSHQVKIASSSAAIPKAISTCGSVHSPRPASMMP